MFYLVLAICASALISIMMRLSEGKAKNAVGLLAVNYFTCLVLSLIFTYADASDLGGQTVPAGLRLLAADARTLALGALNGTFYLSTFLAFQYNIRKNGVVLPSTFAKLGVLVPTLAAIAVFGERPDALQITGVVLAVAAIIYMNSGGASGTAVSSGKALILLLILGGTGDTMSKVYQQIGSEQ